MTWTKNDALHRTMHALRTDIDHRRSALRVLPEQRLAETRQHIEELEREYNGLAEQLE
mgnify:CR=1